MKPDNEKTGLSGWWAVLALVLVVVSGLFVFLREDNRQTIAEPVYNSQPLSDWCHRYNTYKSFPLYWTNWLSFDGDKPVFHDDDMRQRYYGWWSKEKTDAYMVKFHDSLLVAYRQRMAKIAQSEAAVRAMGTNALPALMDMLRYEDSPRTKLVCFFYYRTPLLDWMSDKQKERYIPQDNVSYEKHNNAFVGLELLGSLAEPALKQALADPNPRVRTTATNLLAKIPLLNSQEERESPEEIRRVWNEVMRRRTNAPDTNSAFKPSAYE